MGIAAILLATARDPVVGVVGGSIAMAAKTPRRKVFISFHEEDIKRKKDFVRMMGNRMIDKSVDTGDIDDTDLRTARVRQKIRDEHIRDASVTIVLIGPHTWRRKHVDWEIGSSIRKTKKNSRCGLLGIVLPNHPDYGKKLNPRRIPPRLADNRKGDDPYAFIYDWPNPWAPARIAKWIQRAFVRREGTPPNNGRRAFARNRAGDYRRGWRN